MLKYNPSSHRGSCPCSEKYFIQFFTVRAKTNFYSYKVSQGFSNFKANWRITYNAMKYNNKFYAVTE